MHWGVGDETGWMTCLLWDQNRRGWRLPAPWPHLLALLWPISTRQLTVPAQRQGGRVCRLTLNCKAFRVSRSSATHRPHGTHSPPRIPHRGSPGCLHQTPNLLPELGGGGLFTPQSWLLPSYSRHPPGQSVGRTSREPRACICHHSPTPSPGPPPSPHHIGTIPSGLGRSTRAHQSGPHSGNRVSPLRTNHKGSPPSRSARSGLSTMATRLSPP